MTLCEKSWCLKIMVRRLPFAAMFIMSRATCIFEIRESERVWGLLLRNFCCHVFIHLSIHPSIHSLPQSSKKDFSKPTPPRQTKHHNFQIPSRKHNTNHEFFLPSCKSRLPSKGKRSCYLWNIGGRRNWEGGCCICWWHICIHIPTANLAIWHI
jgi:hypothetical protein